MSSATRSSAAAGMTATTRKRTNAAAARIISSLSRERCQLGELGALASKLAPGGACFLRRAQLLQDDRVHDALAESLRGPLRFRDLRKRFGRKGLELAFSTRTGRRHHRPAIPRGRVELHRAPR